MKQDVQVIIGAGGIGLAISRRCGIGKKVLLSDIDQTRLSDAAAELDAVGYDVASQLVDVSKRASVHDLSAFATELGNVNQVINTAGLSPNMAPANRILEVDLLGTALALEEFGTVICQRGSGIVTSSMAGHMDGPLPPELEDALAKTPADALLDLPLIKAINDPGLAYRVSKRGNYLRIQAECLRWAERGARINSISPGIIMTALARHEISSPSGPLYRQMIEVSASRRAGTAEEVAAAASYLMGSEASFVTGSDLLIDGGVIAAMKMGRLNLGGTGQV